MRIAIWPTLIFLLGVSLSAQTAAPKPPKKGDTIIVRGCLRGSAVEDADLMVEDTEGEVKENDAVPDLTYRLQGDKSVLKELKDNARSQGRAGQGGPEIRDLAKRHRHDRRPDAHHDRRRSEESDPGSRAATAGSRGEVVRGDDGELREIAVSSRVRQRSPICVE